MRRIARDKGIRDRSVKRIAKTELGRSLRSCEKLSFSLKKTNLEAPKILNTFETSRKIWSVDALSTLAIVEHHQYPKSVMVWGGIIASGKTPLGFVGVKINPKVYQRDILKAVVLPWAQKYLGNANWTRIFD
ncbi:uncharacterized protein TNCV_3780861 [Trichonephila clavipes]|nr:uncharacterized protein TNCV_3780861 [Trichonephila clavipes]